MDIYMGPYAVVHDLDSHRVVCAGEAEPIATFKAHEENDAKWLALALCGAYLRGMNDAVQGMLKRERERT